MYPSAKLQIATCQGPWELLSNSLNQGKTSLYLPKSVYVLKMIFLANAYYDF